ncbi:MAG: winged helix-turn-helix domain-containing protein [Acidithiobacillus sp.]
MALNQNNLSVKQQVKAFQARVLSLLTEKPMAVKEIMEATGATQGTVRSALASLIQANQAEGSGGKPVIYKRVMNKSGEEQVGSRRDTYTGSRAPYFRPGSYVPPAAPRVPMFVTDIPDGMLLSADFSADASALSERDTLF